MFFFFNDPATTEIYTLPLHDALPISLRHRRQQVDAERFVRQLADLCHLVDELVVGHRRRTDAAEPAGFGDRGEDRKSTRLNSSHANISYAVFCLKKKTTPPLQSLPSL